LSPFGNPVSVCSQGANVDLNSDLGCEVIDIVKVLKRTEFLHKGPFLLWVVFSLVEVRSIRVGTTHPVLAICSIFLSWLLAVARCCETGWMSVCTPVPPPRTAAGSEMRKSYSVCVFPCRIPAGFIKGYVEVTRLKLHRTYGYSLRSMIDWFPLERFDNQGFLGR
jgi:hypothetical protein